MHTKNHGRRAKVMQSDKRPLQQATRNRHAEMEGVVVGRLHAHTCRHLLLPPSALLGSGMLLPVAVAGCSHPRDLSFGSILVRRWRLRHPDRRCSWEGTLVCLNANWFWYYRKRRTCWRENGSEEEKVGKIASVNLKEYILCRLYWSRKRNTLNRSCTERK